MRPIGLFAFPLILGFSLCGPALALDGTLTNMTVTSPAVPHPVEITVYTPPGYDSMRAEPYPLLVQLHGGGGSSRNMSRMAELLEQGMEAGLIPPVVSVMPSAGRSFYMDFRDGSQKWETFVTRDLLAHMRATTNVAKGREGTLITGISMGGMGALRIGFKHPERFQAVAAMEPGIEPALSFAEVKVRDRFWRADALFERIYGTPVDAGYWAANNPATVAKTDPERLMGLAIYLEAGDQDMYFLHHGTEFLHRILFDAGVSHEYRLVKGAEHVGPSIGPRFLDAIAFLGRRLAPPRWVDAQVEGARRRIDAQKATAGYPVVPADPDRVRTR